jgi:hypothetical protein
VAKSENIVEDVEAWKYAVLLVHPFNQLKRQAREQQINNDGVIFDSSCMSRIYNVARTDKLAYQERFRGPGILVALLIFKLCCS